MRREILWIEGLRTSKMLLIMRRRLLPVVLRCRLRAFERSWWWRVRYFKRVSEKGNALRIWLKEFEVFRLTMIFVGKKSNEKLVGFEGRKWRFYPHVGRSWSLPKRMTQVTFDGYNVSRRNREVRRIDERAEEQITNFHNTRQQDRMKLCLLFFFWSPKRDKIMKRSGVLILILVAERSWRLGWKGCTTVYGGKVKKKRYSGQIEVLR